MELFAAAPTALARQATRLSDHSAGKKSGQGVLGMFS